MWFGINEAPCPPYAVQLQCCSVAAQHSGGTPHVEPSGGLLGLAQRPE